MRFSSLILFVVVILNYVMPAGIFTVISGVSTINFIIVWLIILWAHIKYRAAHPEGNAFAMPGFPYTSWLTIFFFIAILVILLFIDSTRLSLIISLIFFLVLFVASGRVKPAAEKE